MIIYIQYNRIQYRILDMIDLRCGLAWCTTF